MVSEKEVARPLPQWAIELLKGLVLKKMMLRKDKDALLLCDFLMALGHRDTQLDTLRAIAKLNVGEPPDAAELQRFKQQMSEELSGVMLARCSNLNSELS